MGHNQRKGTLVLNSTFFSSNVLTDNKGITVFKISFGEIYRQKYRWKFSFMAMPERSLKRDFRTYIRGYTSPNENFEYGYPHSNALL